MLSSHTPQLGPGHTPQGYVVEGGGAGGIRATVKRGNIVKSVAGMDKMEDVFVAVGGKTANLDCTLFHKVKPLIGVALDENHLPLRIGMTDGCRSQIGKCVIRQACEVRYFAPEIKGWLGNYTHACIVCRSDTRTKLALD